MKDNVWASVRDFCEVVRTGHLLPPIEAERRLGRAIDALGLHAAWLDSREARWKSQRPQQLSDTDIEDQVTKSFSELGFYNAARPVLVQADGTVATTACDAVDDVADIYRELLRASAYLAHESEESALSYLSWSYFGHWGEHLRGLQQYLYERARNREA